MTTILIKKKDTAGAPAPGDLTNAAGGTEIAVNTATRRIYTKDSGGNVVELGNNATSSTIADLTVTNSTTLSYGTANQVQYLNGSKLLVGSANMTFNGTTLTVNDLADSSLTAGRVTYAGTSGNLVDSANLTFNGTTLTANALTVTNAVTLSGGTANGVLYLNGSKVATSGSALTFDGNIFGVNSTSNNLTANFNSDNANGLYVRFQNSGTSIGDVGSGFNLYTGGSVSDFGINARTGSLVFSQGNTYRGRFDTSGNLLVNLATALANGKLQVAGSIGLSGNTEIRQATNSDGNTLRLLATQVVVGATNAISYGYAGSALLASFSNAASATVLEVGGNVAGHRFTVTNDGTGQSGNLNYTNVGGSRFYVNSLTGYAGFGTSSPVDQVSITTVDGGNTAAKLRLTGSNAAGQINFYNTTFPTGQINFDQSGNFVISQSLSYATSTIYPTLTLDTSQQLYMKAATTSFTDIKALRASAFGYAPSSYGALVVGATNQSTTVCINVDPIANTSPSFSGNGGEVMFRNNVQFITPNAANTAFLAPMQFSPTGNVLRPLQCAFMATGDYAVWTTYGVDSTFYVPTNATGAGDGTVNGSNAGFAMTASGGLRFNVGSSYNAANGLFTAPVAGKYFFYAAGLFRRNSGLASDYVQLQLFVNGVGNYAGWDQQPYLYTGTSGMEWVMKVSCLIDLAANDTISMRFSKVGSIQAYAQRFVFGGYLFS